MHAFKNISPLRAALLALGLMSAAAAVPIASKPLATPETQEHSIVDTVSNSTLVGRGPSDAHNGWATYYNVQENRGACGRMNKNNEHVVAIGKSLWESTQGRNGAMASNLCGKTATVQWHGKSVKVRVVDECPVCGYNDVDLSPSAFEQLGNKDIGRLEGISWKFD